MMDNSLLLELPFVCESESVCCDSLSSASLAFSLSTNDSRVEDKNTPSLSNDDSLESGILNEVASFHSNTSSFVQGEFV
jgi:hypothetical protein